MPIARFQMPDGRIGRFEVPEGTSPEQAQSMIAASIGQAPKASERPTTSLGQDILQGAGNVAAGALRGAGSIGATLMTPVDAAARAMGVQNDYIGRTDRRQAMDQALGGMGAETDSLGYGAGKLGAEIAGTAGAGGLLAKGVSAIPGAASKMPALIEALRTSGMSANGATGLGGMATRMAGGAATGAASAGMVNPQDAALGAVVGGALPPAVSMAGKLGQALGNRATKQLAEKTAEFSRNAPKNLTIEESLKAGYIIPPNMVDPSFKNQVIESVSGKQATQQIASAENEKVTGRLVREALGIPQDAPISQSTLENLRKTAGKAYAQVSDLSPQAEMDLEALKKARNEANGWFQAYNRSARPDDLAKAKDARDLSQVLELQLEAHAKNAGKESLIPALRDARKQIAKTYTVGRAINDASGTIDARVLGRMSEKGLPLSDGLEVAGKFASAFPTIAKSSQQVGSPAAHNLKSMASLLMGGGGMASAGPIGLAAGAVPFVAPPIARSLMFREGAQRALMPSAPQMSKSAQIAQLLANPELQQLLLRGAPIAAAQ